MSAAATSQPVSGMPPVEEGDILLVDCSRPKGSNDAAWVPASVVHDMQRRMEQMQAEHEAVLRGVQQAIFSGRFRGDGLDPGTDRVGVAK